jgi:hypothetical protein
MLVGSVACLAAAVVFVPAAVRLLGWEQRERGGRSGAAS